MSLKPKLAPPLKLANQLARERNAVGNHAVLRHTEDRGSWIVVHGYDGLSTADSRDMLDCAGNAKAEQELGRYRGTRLPHLMRIVEPTGLHKRARAAKFSP